MLQRKREKKSTFLLSRCIINMEMNNNIELGKYEHVVIVFFPSLVSTNRSFCEKFYIEYLIKAIFRYRNWQKSTSGQKNIYIPLYDSTYIIMKNEYLRETTEIYWKSSQTKYYTPAHIWLACKRLILCSVKFIAVA